MGETVTGRDVDVLIAVGGTEGNNESDGVGPGPVIMVDVCEGDVGVGSRPLMTVDNGVGVSEGVTVDFVDMVGLGDGVLI